jgi:hypothetical protein
MVRLYLVTLSLVVAASVACRAPPPPLTRAEVLAKLHQCRDDLGKERPTGRSKPVPCTTIDPTPMNGISRTELEAALGPPTFCMGLSERGSPSGADCPPELNPGWAFYLIGRNGPELICETDEKQRCEVMRWIRME